MAMIRNNVRGIGRDFEYMRNAPHFYGIRANEAPRLPGYITAVATALPVAGVTGWIVDEVARVVTAPLQIIFDGVYHNPSGFEFVVAPFRALEGPGEFLLAATGVAGIAVGVTVGARAGLAAGRRVADFWTRIREDRNDVRTRVRNYYRDVAHISPVVPRGLRESPLDAETRRYMAELYPVM